MKLKNKPKCKEWEKRRREKLNDAFNLLAQLLPNYDPAAKNIPKIDIILRSTQFVKELRLSNSRLLTVQAETDEKCKLINQLQDEVNKLILRVKQLTGLLKSANIPIPCGPHIKGLGLGSKKIKWSGKEKQNKDVGLQGDPKPSLSSSHNQLGDVTNPKEDEIGNSQKSDSTNKTSNGNTTSEKNPLPDIEIIFLDKNCSRTSKEKPDNVQGNVAVSSDPKESSGHDEITEVAIPGCAKTTTNLEQKDPSKATLSTPPTILPMQTIILTSCPIGSSILSPSLTRIGLTSTMIQNGMNGAALQKIPIVQIRKPIPKVIKRRKSRKKNVLMEVINNVAAEMEIVLPKTSDVIETTVLAGESGEAYISTEQQQRLPIIAETTNSNKLPSDTPSLIMSEQVSAVNPQEKLRTEESSAALETAEIIESNPEELMQIQLYAEPEQENMDIDRGSSVTEKILTEINKPTPPKEAPSNATSASLETEATTPEETDTPILTSDNSNPKIPQERTSPIIAQVQIQPTLSPNQNQWSTSPEPVVELQGSQQAVKLSNFDTTMDIDQVPTPNQESSSSSEVNGDKISECIARSIDLIDAPDGELMELGDNWGDPANSPKSPISPTQMFLSMFPLLPRDSVVGDGAQIVTSTSVVSASRPAQSYLSTSHRSFYIDSMLPEDNNQAELSQLKSAKVHSDPIAAKSPPKTTEGSLSLTTLGVSNTTAAAAAAAAAPQHNLNKGTISSNYIPNTALNSKESNSSKPQRTTTLTTAASSQHQQHLFRDLFSDSIDFNFSTVPFPQFPEHDLFREPTRSRGLFDHGLELTPLPPTSERIDLSESSSDPQARDTRERNDVSQRRLEQFRGDNENRASSYVPQASKTSTATSSASISSSFTISSHQPSTQDLQSFPSQSITSRSYSNAKTTPPKGSPAAAVPAYSSQPRNLFRPPVSDFHHNIQIQHYPSTTPIISHQEHLGDGTDNQQRAHTIRNLEFQVHAPKTSSFLPSETNTNKGTKTNDKRQTNPSKKSTRSQKEGSGGKGRSKDNSKDKTNKAAHDPKAHQHPPITNFHQFPIMTENFGSTSSQQGFFQNFQNFDQNLNIFPDFSLPTETNVHYDQSTDFNFSLNQHPNNFQQEQSQSLPTTRCSSRPTPFYLQNVCDTNFSYGSSSSSSHEFSHQFHQSNNSQNQNASTNHQSQIPSHYSHVPPEKPHNQPTTSQYYQPHCQLNYPIQPSIAPITEQQCVARRHIAPSHQSSRGVEAPHNFPQTSSSQHSLKTKHASSNLSSSQSQSTSSYVRNSSDQQQQQSHQTGQIHHRPSVNWMAESNTNSQHMFRSSNQNQSKLPTTNPFSVSKLVGVSNSSASAISNNPQQIPNNILSPSHNPITNNNGNVRQSSSSRTANNYCAEALIRKNPVSTTQWSKTTPSNTTFFQPSGPTNPHIIQPQQTNVRFAPNHNSLVPPNQTQFNEDVNFSYNFHNPSQHGFADSAASTHVHHNQINFNPHSHSTHIGSGGGVGTSSVSNFNLSTIFPEINEKQRQTHQQNAGGGNASNSSGSNSRNNGNIMSNSSSGSSSGGGSAGSSSNSRAASTSNGSCGYYSQSTGHGPPPC